MDKLRGLVDYEDDEDPASRDGEKSFSEERAVDKPNLESNMNASNDGSDQDDSISCDRKDIKAGEGDKKLYNSDDRNVGEKKSQCDKSNDSSKKHQNDTFDRKRSSKNDKVPSKNRSSHKSSRRSRSRSHEDDRHWRKDDQRDYRRSHRSSDKHYRDTRKEESRDSSRFDRDRRKSDREHEDSKSRYSRDSKSSSGRRINHRDYKDHHSSDNRSFRESKDTFRSNSDFSSKDAHTNRHGNHSYEHSTANIYDEARREENANKSNSIHQLPPVNGDFVDTAVNKDRALDTSYSSPSPSTVPASQSSLSSSLTASATSSNVPRYYKQSTFNATKFAIQEEKKKLLWSSTKKDDSQPKETPKVWHGLQFSGAQGQQMTEKFLKLMGSKTTTAPDKVENQDSMVKYQENLFKDLDKQYSLARMSTHTHRGIGLGFSSHPSPK